MFWLRSSSEVVVLCLFSTLILSVHLAKDNAKKKKDKKPLPNIGSRTYEQWATLPLESLRLHCEAASLPIDGDCYDLAARLFRFHHQQSNNDNLPAVTSTLAVTSSSALDLLMPVQQPGADHPTLEWLIPPLQAEDVFENTFSAGLLSMPSLSAPDGGYIFTSAASTSSTHVPFSALDGIPRVTIRRQPLVSSSQPSTVPDSPPPPPRTSPPPPYASQVPASSSSASTHDQAQPGPSSATDDNDVIINLQRELASLRNSISALSQFVTNNLIQATDNTTGNTFAHPASLHAALPTALPQPDLYASSALRPRPTLPPVPQRLLLCIQRGQFVSFDALYAATAHAVHSRAADRSSLFSLAISTDGLGGPAIDVLPRAVSAREKVTNYHSWSMAFTLFLRCATYFRSHLALPLVRYQGIINGFANAYVPNAWLSYDIAFRHHVANNPEVPWDRVDEEIFTVHLRSAQSLARCFLCHATGHLAAACPRSSATSSRSASYFTSSQASRAPTSLVSSSRAGPSSSSAPSSAPPLRGSPSAPICFAWSSAAGCTRPFCRYRHVCPKCGGAHRRAMCST